MILNDETKNQMTLFDVPAEKKAKETPPAPKEVKKVDRKAKESANRSAVATRIREKKPVQVRKNVAKETARRTEPAKAGSGQIPEGDVRLTANIRQDLHLKLKIAAAHRRTTIGELIEELVGKYL